jgi:hypothetical protein
MSPRIDMEKVKAAAARLSGGSLGAKPLEVRSRTKLPAEDTSRRKVIRSLGNPCRGFHCSHFLH